MKEQGDVTVAELARKLGMAPVSVRHHLDVLQGENLIWTPRVRRRGTVGRPRQVYALTEAANECFPRNHGSLAASLLDQLKGVVPAQQLQTVFERMADSMALEAKPLPEDASLEERLENAVDFLNDKGYLARYEKRDEGYVIYTLNCPYAGVADKHHELCAMDLRLMDRLLGSAPAPVSRLSEGGCRCTYRVNGAQDGAAGQPQRTWIGISESHVIADTAPA
jgi:predicted ArsR family transcriptional regulator